MPEQEVLPVDSSQQVLEGVGVSQRDVVPCPAAWNLTGAEEGVGH